MAAAFPYRIKRADQAMNYPFQRTFQNKPPYGKDRQRYPLYLTVFWFRPAGISKKTVRNTVNYLRPTASNLLDVCLFPLYFNHLCGKSARLNNASRYRRRLFKLLKYIDNLS